MTTPSPYLTLPIRSEEEARGGSYRERATAEQIRAAEAREGVSAVNHTNEMLSSIHAPAMVEDGWEDISSAPYDGTLVLVRDRGWSPCHARYVGTRFVDGYWSFTEFTSFAPTHWMPLPAPPHTEGGRDIL